MKYKVGDIVVLYNNDLVEITRINDKYYYYNIPNFGETLWAIHVMEKNSRLATKLERALK